MCCVCPTAFDLSFPPPLSHTYIHTSGPVIPAGINAYNPSQDLLTMVSNLRNAGQKSVIAVAPAIEEEEGEQLPPHENKLSSLLHPSGGYYSEKGKEGDVRHSSLYGQKGREGGARAEGGGGRVGSENLAAQELSSWLIDELGGSDG